ncbi:ATP-binding cassette sub-family C member 3-like isoform X2 [Oscarella lobularis]|uniref:ATP-binding cassette sub-family C member 3-like isoform X2 n=1 Tax=Oscarella lobularis TaxID=121494 RepID=UPI0033133C61
MTVVGLATRMNRARKKRSSGVLFIFWMLICVYGAVRLRATYLLEDSIFRSELRLALSGVQLALFGFSFIASCFSNWKPIGWTDGDDDQPVPCPADSAGFLSNVTYSWMNKIIYTGFKRPLTESDLPGLSVDHTTTDIVASFTTAWKNKSRRVVPALWSISRRLLLSAILLQLAAVPFAVLPSLFVDVLINFSRADATKTPTWHGVVVAALLFVVCLANALAAHRSQQYANVAGMRARAALTGIVYRKLVRLSANARRVFATGDIVNLLAADAERIMEFYPRVPQFFGAVVCTIVAVAYMGTIVGLSALYCLIALAFFLPILVCLLGMLKRYQDSQMRIKDERLRTTTEALSGIKVVKLYAWEWAFTSRIDEMRNDELQYIYRSKIVNGSLVAILTSIPVFIQIVALVTYIASHHRLDAETAFVVVTLVSLVNASLINIPVALSAFAQSLTACRRLDEFLASEDVDETSVEWIERTRREPGDEKIQDAVRIDDGNFKWCAYESPILQGLSLRIREGTLLAVVGQVGVGKSSLLSAMLGDMVKSSGSLTVAGSVAYVSQVPWIRNATVKENILFGNAFDSKWYRRVVKACALEPDFDVLPARDSTEIGEKGVNLSGGQRTRISLARAVYAQADVYLLDDPLSAVDSQVGKRIFEKVIGSHGLLKNKTIILVTHCLTFMPRVDLILVLKDGGVSQLGSYSELKERGGDFAEYLEEYSQPSADASCVTSDATIDDTSCELSRSQHWAWRSSGEVHLLPVSKKRRRRRVGVSPLVAGERSPLLATGTHETTGDETGDGNGALTDDEQLETGTVKFRVFVDYLKAGGLLSAIMFLFFVFIGMGCTTFGNVWLAEWTDTSTSETKSKDYNEALYGFIYCASAIFGGLFLFVDGLFLARTAGNASATIHRRLVERVFRFPLVFFDVTPLGRVVARFAKDVYIVDGILADSFQRLVAVAVASVGSLVVIALAVPAFVVVAVVVVPVYVLLQRFYVASSRQLRRLRAASRSPLFSLIGETMQGASTVRAFRRVDALVAENDRLADVQQRCFFYFTSGTRWIGVRLEFLAAVITFSVALLVVFLRGSQSAGYVGLALSSGYGFFGLMTGLLNSASLFETNLVALERLREYDEVETEGFGIIPHRRPPRDWPHRGEIEFRSYSARYRQGQPLILKNISCKIRSDWHRRSNGSRKIVADSGPIPRHRSLVGSDTH